MLPAPLLDALQAAVDLGVGATVEAAAASAVRDAVEAFAQNVALEDHLVRIGWRPSLFDLAVAAARLDGSPLADERTPCRESSRRESACPRCIKAVTRAPRDSASASTNSSARPWVNPASGSTRPSTANDTSSSSRSYEATMSSTSRSTCSRSAAGT